MHFRRCSSSNGGSSSTFAPSTSLHRCLHAPIHPRLGSHLQDPPPGAPAPLHYRLNALPPCTPQLAPARPPNVRSFLFFPECVILYHSSLPLACVSTCLLPARTPRPVPLTDLYPHSQTRRCTPRDPSHPIACRRHRRCRCPRTACQACNSHKQEPADKSFQCAVPFAGALAARKLLHTGCPTGMRMCRGRGASAVTAW